MKSSNGMIHSANPSFTVIALRIHQTRCIGGSSCCQVKIPTEKRCWVIFLVSSRYLSFGILVFPEFEALFECTGGTVDKRKSKYVKLQPVVSKIVARMSVSKTDRVNVFYFTYDEWSAKIGAPIARMTFKSID